MIVGIFPKTEISPFDGTYLAVYLSPAIKLNAHGQPAGELMYDYEKGVFWIFAVNKILFN